MKIYAAAVILICNMCLGLRADLLLNALSFNNSADTLRDDGVGGYYDLDNSTTMTPGDVLQGMVQIAEVIPDGQGGLPINSLYGVFSMQVSSVAGRDISLAPGGGVHSIDSILGRAGMSTAGLTSYSGNSSNAAFAWLEKPTAAPLANMTASGNANDLLITNNAIGNSISAANGWSIAMTTGMTGDDFYKINLNDSLFADLTQLALIDPDMIIAQYRTAQSIIAHSFGPNKSFGTLFVDSDFTTGQDNRSGDLISSGNNLFAEPGDVAQANGWGLATDGNFRLVAHAPEPTSMALVLVAGGITVLRRKR